MIAHHAKRAAALYGLILMMPIYLIVLGGIMNRVQSEATAGRVHLAGFRAELAAENALINAIHRHEWIGPARLERLELGDNHQLWVATGWHELPSGQRVERTLQVHVRWPGGVATIVDAQGFSTSH
jgi:hypothetical protein